jgi:hypothetical protein
VLTAVKFMHAGAVGTAAYLIIALAFIGDIRAYHLTVLGHHLTTAQLSHQRPLIITLVIAAGLALIALWLWMARAVGQGRNWARILSTVLFGLATLELISVLPQYPGRHLGHFVIGGQVQPVIHFGFGVTVLGLIVPVLTWLVGLAAVWLLWRPASSAFFKPQGFTQAGHSAQPSAG